MKILFFISFAVLGLLFLGIVQALWYYDGKLHILFCNVGQGDSFYIRTPSRTDILIDGGPDKSVLDCLYKHMPFWDREIDLVIVTHPHSDHYLGVIEVLKGYLVKEIGYNNYENSDASYKHLKELIAKENSEFSQLCKGTKTTIDEAVMLEVLWPECVNGIVLDSQTPNENSLIIHVNYKNLDILFTGDAEEDSLVQIPNLPSVEILKVPHQGSKGAINSQLLEIINPQVGVIPVGKNNYGHPNPGIVQLLEDSGVKVFRTDEGTIEVISDGETWSVKQSKN